MRRKGSTGDPSSKVAYGGRGPAYPRLESGGVRDHPASPPVRRLYVADLHQRGLTESVLLSADDGGLRGFVRRCYRKANAASVDDSGHSPSARVLRGECRAASSCLPGQDDAAPLPLARVYRAFTNF